MKDHGYSQIPVFEGKHSVGSISEKAILRQIMAGKRFDEISKLPTEEIMEEAFPQINEDAPLCVNIKPFADLLGCFSFKKRRSNRHHYQGRFAKNDLAKCPTPIPNFDREIL